MRYRIASFNILFLLPVLVILIGSIGFMLLENLSFIDAVYFTIVTISTVGYGVAGGSAPSVAGFLIPQGAVRTIRYSNPRRNWGAVIIPG